MDYLPVIAQVLGSCSPLRPTSRSSGGGNGGTNNGLTVGIADDQAKDFDFEKTEMKYDSTGMFHWCPARSLEDCILVSCSCLYVRYLHSMLVTLLKLKTCLSSFFLTRAAEYVFIYWAQKRDQNTLPTMVSMSRQKKTLGFWWENPPWRKV